MEYFVLWTKQNTAWLYLQIYENQFFFIDFWSLAHLWSGFVVFAILLAYRNSHPWLWLIIYLFVYEIVEITILYLSLYVFDPETIKDQFTDVFVGFLGAILCYFFVRQKARRKNTFFEKIDFEALFVAETLSFLWIGNLHFFFMQPDSSDPLSITNYLWRILLGYMLLLIYGYYKSREDNFLQGLMVFALAYFSLYILTAFLLGNAFMGGRTSVIFGISGSPVNIHEILFQLRYPFVAILFYEKIRLMFNKAAAEFANRGSVKRLKRKIIFKGLPG